MCNGEIQEKIAGVKRIIIPIGSLEQHGEHLPVSTDSLIAEFIARKTADRIGAFVLPVLPIGISFEHVPMFNISISHGTLSKLLEEICISLSANGFEKIVVINGHHGNSGILQYLSQSIHGCVKPNLTVDFINYWHMIRSAEFDHAGYVETSLVLAIAPELVSMYRAHPNTKPLNKSKPAYSSITCKHGSFPKITGNGVWGDPREANRNAGNELLEEIVKNLTSTILHELE